MRFCVTMVLITWSSVMLALDGEYERIDGKAKLTFEESGDWMWSGQGGEDGGVYEIVDCGSKEGDLKITQANGRGCCLSRRSIAEKLVLENDRSGRTLCAGGVFSRTND